MLIGVVSAGVLGEGDLLALVLSGDLLGEGVDGIGPHTLRLLRLRRDGAGWRAEAGPTNFADVARSFGCEGIRVDEAEQIAPALKRALEMNAPVVVDVATSMDSRGPDAWSP